jgi:hypothetical protein
MSGCGSSTAHQSAPPTMTVPRDPSDPEDARDAARIALRDDLVKDLVGTSRAGVTESTDWFRGVELVLSVNPPVEVDADLPYVEVPPDAPATGDCTDAYARGWQHERASNVRRVIVLVDLRRKRAVDIRGESTDATFEDVADRPHPHCKPVEGGSGPDE